MGAHTPLNVVVLTSGEAAVLHTELQREPLVRVQPDLGRSQQRLRKNECVFSSVRVNANVHVNTNVHVYVSVHVCSSVHVNVNVGATPARRSTTSI